MLLRSPILNTDKDKIKEKFYELYKTCYDVTKCIIQTRDVSKNQITIDNYCKELTQNYNTFIDFSLCNAVNLEQSLSEKFKTKIKTLKNRVAESFLRINLKFSFDGDIFQKITDSNLEISFVDFTDDPEVLSDESETKNGENDTEIEDGILNSTEIEEKTEKSEDHTETNLTGAKSKKILPEKESPITETILTDKKATKITVKMPDDSLTSTQFLRLCSNQINKNYSGEPTSLQSFIDCIN